MKTRKKNNNKTNTQADKGKFTMVKTGYARAAILLLAFNFCLTAYAFMRLNDYVDQRLSVEETGSAYPVEMVQETKN